MNTCGTNGDRGGPMIYTWESLILPEDTLKQLKRIGEALRTGQALDKQRQEAPPSLLLYGPPGSCIPQIARTLAVETNRAYIEASPADLKTVYLGQNWRGVKELFERAQGREDSLLFIT